MKKSLAFISLLLLSCNSEYGNHVEGDKLSVYFPNPDDQEMASEIARYWRDHDLLTGEEQDLQLLSHEGDYQLLLISNQSEKGKSIPMEEQMLFSQLQKDLRKELTNDQAYFEIIICDEQFNPIFNINQ